jgi:pimeloyl-ACP methyl ester carboxylesterase
MTLGAAGKGGTVLLAGAAALAAAAVWNNVRARRAERDHSPRGRFIEVDGVRLHYLERGAGPPVVLLHGNVVTAEDYLWSGVLDRVAKHHRVVAIDRPGFGYSDRPKGRLWTPAQQAALLHRTWSKTPGRTITDGRRRDRKVAEILAFARATRSLLHLRARVF